jgi:hypothetical protein
VGTDPDLEGLDERELLEVVVGELRALRRLVGTIFLVVVAFGLVGVALSVMAT